MSFDYKEYSLENLESWLHDAMSSGEATAEEIYDCIWNAVSENYEHHRKYASQAYELLCKLKDVNQKKDATYDEMIAAGYWMTDDGFWMPPEKKNHSDNLPHISKVTKVQENNQYTDEELDAMCDAAAHADTTSTITKKKTWIVPVEEVINDDTYETDYKITFPQDMLEHTGWGEGDQIEWVDRKDGAFEIRKVGEPK